MKNTIEIHLAIYRCSVLVAWEVSLEKVLKYTRKRGCKITDEEIKDDLEFCKNAQGVTFSIGKDNTDVLIWLKERPRKASSYGTLYHEIFHAVDQITKSHNLQNESEGRAFLYEYISTQCNNLFWSMKR